MFGCNASEDYLNKASSLYDQKKLNDAIKYIDKYITQHENDCNELIASGESLLKSKRPELARRFFEKARDKCQSNKKAEALYKLAKSCANCGDNTAKRTACNQLKNYPNYHEDDTFCGVGISSSISTVREPLQIPTAFKPISLNMSKSNFASGRDSSFSNGTEEVFFGSSIDSATSYNFIENRSENITLSPDFSPINATNHIFYLAAYHSFNTTFKDYGRSVTWDFEDGNLAGWNKSGSAFDFQPTWGDNVAARGAGHSGHVGNYWIGTYEHYVGQESIQAQGNIQGDVPTGILRSTPFRINGDTISFLLGGGKSCSVKLIVNGITVRAASGNDAEAMNRVVWDVSAYRGMAAVLEVVDDSSAMWGHINFDDVRFDVAPTLLPVQ